MRVLHLQQRLQHPSGMSILHLNLKSPNWQVGATRNYVWTESDSSAAVAAVAAPKTKKKKSNICTSKVMDFDNQNWLSSLTTSSSSSSEWVIGIDPDVSGALALLNPTLDSPQVYDSPHLKLFVGKRIRRRLDPKAIIQLLQSFHAPPGTIAYLEQSLPFPQDGKQGWWSGGFNYGLWIGALVALGFSVVPVPSLLWKNQFKLSGNGSNKDASREAACTLFPSISSQLTRKKDHGRAEALLIAAYGKSLQMSSSPPPIVSEDTMS